jgi:small subunit ribosomal protein S1
MQPSERQRSETDSPPGDRIPSASAVPPLPVNVARPVSEPDEEDMASLMAASDQELHSPRRGEMIEGIVVSTDRDGILVDVGSKSEGLIPPSELIELLPHLHPKVGDKVYVVVIQPEGRSEHALLSLTQAREERGWVVVQSAAEAGSIVDALVLEVNRGGLVVDVESLRGFIPLSQIARIRSVVPAAGAEPDAALAELVGQTMPVKVLEVNRGRNRLILSERLAVQELRGARREQLLAELKEGEIRHGRVTGLAEFGAFVDIGGTDGLVHLSELAWHPVANPSDIVAVGDEVDVVVLGVDRERQKVSLSIRRTQPEPWTLAGDRYVVGALVTGKIARLTTFGAFVRLDDGIEGLIHVSELSDRHIVHPRNVVKEGDVVTVRVLRVEAERRRLGLSLRQAVEPDIVDGVMSYPPEES